MFRYFYNKICEVNSIVNMFNYVALNLCPTEISSNSTHLSNLFIPIKYKLPNRAPLHYVQIFTSKAT